MDTGRGFLAGVIGGAVVTILLAIGRALGLELNLSMTLGTMLGMEAMEASTWLVGFLMHLVISGIIGVLYAIGFESITDRASWLVGLGFAIVHLIIAGVLVGFIGYLHPLIPEFQPAPGAFLANMGAAYVAAFVALHLLFGAIVGGIYETREQTLHHRHDRVHYDEVPA